MPTSTRTPGRLAVLTFVAAALLTACTGGPDTAPGAAPASSAAAASTDPLLADVQTYPASQQHVTGPVTYAQTPPAGGPHNPVWLNCGIYDAPVPNENAVHSMEHGAVWITYDPALAADQVAALQQTVNTTYEVLSPYPGLPAPVVASAWGKQLTLTGAEDPRLPAFIRAYRQGPQTPEPGAPCTGGTDATGFGGTTMALPTGR
jgi:hypothetical protein